MDSQPLVPGLKVGPGLQKGDWEMERKAVLVLLAALVGVGGLLVPAGLEAQRGEGDPDILRSMNEANGTLRAEWMDLRAEWMDLRAEWMDMRVEVEQIEVLTLGGGKASSRIHRQPFRWVPGDGRRAADGTNLTYLVDPADPAPLADAAAAEAAIDRAVATWAADPCLGGTEIVKRTADGADPDLFDSLLGFGGRGDFRLADVVHAGWMPPEFFDAVAGPGGGESVLALSVTFVWVYGSTGEPTDIDGNGYLDTATNEIYYNSAFAWGSGGVDPQTVALHELGHSLGIGHVSPPPEAVMNPVYDGVRTGLAPLDSAALCTIWGSWPH
jgi:hypothetical protein